ncbi:MAG: GGDEF domain-containing protein [Gammaproteobacteria bacterium]
MMRKFQHDVSEFLDQKHLIAQHMLLEDDEHREDFLEMTQVLQTTLDLDRLLGLFSIELSKYVPHDFFRYRNNDLDIEQVIGQRARYSCTYTLKLSDEVLGKISLRRNHKFQDDELKLIEQSVICLLYPLRNALLYLDAIHMAQRDPLTGIQNRAAFDEALRRELSHAERHDSTCALIMLDIDLFKSINDRYGHLVGDCALKSFTHMANSCIRDGDVLFRYGGEEFAVLMRETGLTGAEQLAERIRRNIEQHPCTCGGSTIQMTISAGVTEYEADDSVTSFISRADLALYKAKEDGRNRTCSRISTRN